HKIHTSIYLPGGTRSKFLQFHAPKYCSRGSIAFGSNPASRTGSVHTWWTKFATRRTEFGADVGLDTYFCADCPHGYCHRRKLLSLSVAHAHHQWIAVLSPRALGTSP